jgi:hypothetical protein
MMTACTSGVNQCEQPCHAGTIQALGGLAAVHDDVDQLGVVDHGHSPNLLRLGLEGNASFPDPTGKWQVSKSGGAQPRWRRDGKELFYISLNRVMAVDINASPAFQPGTPKVLFETRGIYGYDVSADGKQFLINVPVADSGGDLIIVVLNWRAGLKK